MDIEIRLAFASMPAILAKKIGMTQRFQEDGRVERVTVLEAGPCPVTAIRTRDADGYEAVQLGFGAMREKALSRAELGTSRRPPPRPSATSWSSATRPASCTVGDTVTVEAFEVGQKVKVAGASKGKGFQGTIKRHHFPSGPESHGSHNMRAPARSARRPRPSRVFKGMKARQMGGKRVTQKGLTVVELIPDRT